MRAGVLAVICCVVFSVAPARGTGASPTPCRPASSRTLGASESGRVFDWHGHNWVCLYAQGIRKRLDLSTRTTGVTVFGPVRFAGPYIAYARHLSHRDEHGHDDDWMEVIVADPRPLRPRTVQKRYAASDEVLTRFRRDRPRSDRGSNGEAVVTDMALSRTGSVAWIECPTEDVTHCWRGPDPLGLDNPEWRSVFRAAARDRSRTKLDEGASIRRRSLVLHRSRLTWIKAGRSRTAKLR